MREDRDRHVAAPRVGVWMWMAHSQAFTISNTVAASPWARLPSCIPGKHAMQRSTSVLARFRSNVRQVTDQSA